MKPEFSGKNIIIAQSIFIGLSVKIPTYLQSRSIFARKIEIFKIRGDSSFKGKGANHHLRTKCPL